MIRYKLYQNKMEGNTGYNLWYARAVCDETYDTEMLAKHMSTHNTPYSPGVIHGVLKDMIACIKELLLDGKNVKLDDLAIFLRRYKEQGCRLCCRLQRGRICQRSETPRTCHR